MIHEEDSDPVIDFSWFYFVGRCKLHLTFKETGRMTLTFFMKLYQHYKNDWDVEMRLRNHDTTYEEAFVKSQKAEEWF